MRGDGVEGQLLVAPAAATAVAGTASACEPRHACSICMAEEMHDPAAVEGCSHSFWWAWMGCLGGPFTSYCILQACRAGWVGWPWGACGVPELWHSKLAPRRMNDGWR